MVDRRERAADRILDTAKDLLLRWGYRRVTIDEIAARSGLGKGTVYLHWRTRDQIFLAVAAREAAAMNDAVAAAMAADPREIALHRYIRWFFVEAMERPVLGYDGDYRVIPAPIVAAIYALVCLTSLAFGVFAAVRGSTVGAVVLNLDTGDMTRLPYDDGTFDLIVSSLAIHNVPGMAGRLAAVEEAARVLRPGGRVAIADTGFTRRYAGRLRELGLDDVRRRSLGWRSWWAPGAAIYLVTAANR